MILSDSFKIRLKEAMSGESNNSFAEKCELSEGTFRRYLRGETFPPLDTLEKIAQASGCSLAWLASGEGEMRRGEGATEQQEAAPVLDLELMEEIIVNTISASSATGEDYKDLIVITKAMMDASSIIEEYRLKKGLPSLSAEEIHNKHINMLAALKDQMTALADKRDKEREG